MTTPESITTSLNTSKKLAEVGFKKDTVFVWLTFPNPNCGALLLNSLVGPRTVYKAKYPAPTSSEIELPSGFMVVKRRASKGYYCGRTDGCEVMDTDGDTEVEAKALMFLELKERGLI